jgi:hypothetical protein
MSSQSDDIRNKNKKSSKKGFIETFQNLYVVFKFKYLFYINPKKKLIWSYVRVLFFCFVIQRFKSANKRNDQKYSVELLKYQQNLEANKYE